MTLFLNKSAARRDLPKLAFRLLCKTVLPSNSNAWIRLSDREIAEMGNGVEELSHMCAEDFRQHYMLRNYLSKYKGLRTGIDTKAVALSNFTVAEDQCTSTNLRLSKRNPTHVDPILHRAVRLIANLLGPFSWNKVADLGAWGPGSTFEFPRSVAYLDTKMVKLPISATRECASLFADIVHSDPHWVAAILGFIPDGPCSVLGLVKSVPGSRIETVPKNAKTDRTIAIEPRANLFLQKGFGKAIRSRLRSVGVDLDDQSVNQKLAERAYMAKLATIDLKAASDTISSELVYLLLPLDWALALDRVRSKEYTLDGSEFHKFSKFSSMGNGFTFELESLIFWALVAAVEESTAVPEFRDGSRTCAVYGDDLIVRQECAVELISVLSYCGFTTNADKSFVSGPFYESCGRHYFLGEDVTPRYQKELVDASEEEFIRFYNRLARWGLTTVNEAFDKGLEKLFHECVNTKNWYPSLPPWAEGDDGLVRPCAGAVMGCMLVCNVVKRARSRVPVYEDAHYAYALRLASRSRPRAWFLRLADLNSPDSFDGYLESRDSRKEVRLKKGSRALFI